MIKKWILYLLEKIRNIILIVIDWLYKPFKNIFPQTTFRYACTGGFNTLLDIFLYFIVYNYVFEKQFLVLPFINITPHIASFLLVFPITFTTGFLLSKYITFTKSNLKGKKQLIRYVITVIGSILLNYLCLKFFVEFCGLWATVAKIITTIITVVYSYTMQMYFTFQIKTK